MEQESEITKALRLFYESGNIFEVRILDAECTGYHRSHIESGYFDYDHIEEVENALKKMTSARGVYITPNAVNPALLARAANRIRAVGKAPATSDADITRRRWLLIDCDAVRPSGISANDEEHDAALYKGIEISEGLKSMGWPDPIFSDSGNGAQLMYRIDLPVDDEGLVQACLKALSPVGDEKVQIDQTVYNPARIWRLPGTMNCKGDNLPERPHRMAKIIEAPERLKVVPREKLMELAGTVRKQEDKTSANVDLSVIAGEVLPSIEQFNIDDWIRKHCPGIEGPFPWNSGRKWIFSVCPFNEAHTNRSALITEQSSGAIGFTCHHNGCKNYDWKALRKLKEPNKIPINLSDVDISGITEKIAPQKKTSKEDILKDPGPLPEELLSVPGFINEVMNYTLRTAPYPNKILAFAGALTLQAFLAGRKIIDNMRNLTNIYLIALADSGTGKEHPRLVNREIISAAGFSGKVGDAFASGEGIEDVMYINHAMLFQTDEIDSLMTALGSIKDARTANIVAVLLKMFSTSSSTYDLRIKAGDKNPRSINKPSLTLFGTAIPEYFYEALNSKMLKDGLMARSIVMEAGERGEGQEPDYEPLPGSIIQAAEWWAEFNPNNNEKRKNNLAEINPFLKPLPFEQGTKKRSFEIMKLAENEYKKCKEINDPIGQTEWTRVFHKARRLALIYAASQNRENPVLTVEALEWGWKFMKYHTEQMIFKAHTRVSENSFHAECQKLLEKLRKSACRQLSHSVLLKRMKVKTKDFKEIIETLLEQGDVEVIKKETEGRIGCFYKLLGD